MCEVILSLRTENTPCRRLLSLGQQVYSHIYIIGAFCLWDSKCIAVLRDFSVQYYILLLMSIGVLSQTNSTTIRLNR